jgi:SAM-dependent methyltransferase
LSPNKALMVGSESSGRPSYASLRVGRLPNQLLVDALDLLDVREGRALDIGAGPLNDTRFLLQAGLAVDAVDTDPLILSAASTLKDRRLNAIVDDICNVRIARDAYSLIVAIHVLPFLRRADLPLIMSSIINGLRNNGVLCCTFFGVNDGWAQRRPHITFLSRSEIDSLFPQLRPIEFSELEYDGADANDSPKRWHIFRCILRK